MVDWKAALESTAGSPGLLNELIAVALEEIPKLERLLDEALAAENAREVQRVAHTIKGTGRVFADRKLIEAAGKVEALGESANLDQIEPSRRELEAETARFLAELQQSAEDEGSK